MLVLFHFFHINWIPVIIYEIIINMFPASSLIFSLDSVVQGSRRKELLKNNLAKICLVFGITKKFYASTRSGYNFEFFGINSFIQIVF